MVRNITLALYGLVIVFLMATGMVLAQSPSASPMVSPSPSSSTVVPSAAPSTGHG